MRSIITHTLLENLYTMLRSTPPFNRWKLPEADAVGFVVTHNKERCGQFHGDGLESNDIEISAALHETIASVTITMAHEMVHLHEALKFKRKDVRHGAFFHHCADLVCKDHKFDRLVFQVR